MVCVTQWDMLALELSSHLLDTPNDAYNDTESE